MCSRLGAEMNGRLILALLLLMTILCISCGGGSSGDDAGSEINVSFKDSGGPGNDASGKSDAHSGDDSVLPGETSVTPEVPVVVTGCGDGVCQGAETADSCAKDCLEETLSAAFLFAHKGEELASLGRIFDLAQAGADVYVFYLTFDDTPLEDSYGNDPGKLAPASLGVAPQSIYVYEQYIDWGIVSGNHEVLDRLTQHLATLEPDHVYLPQLCGGDLESELAHVAGYWAAKRAKIFPEFFEVPVPSSYFEMEDPSPELAGTNPDQFVDRFTRRWKLVPKGGEEKKTTLATEDMAQIRMAASHIQNEWFQQFMFKLPDDRLLYLLREVQRYRSLPPDQKTDERPWLQSMDNPEGLYIYNQVGYSFDEFKQLSRVIESFFGTNVRSDPSALPYYDEVKHVKIVHDFDVVLDIRSFSPEVDNLSFKIGFGPAKDPTEDCVTPEEVEINPLETTQVVVKCNAMEPIGEHTYYFRVYSDLAKENNDAAKFTEVPYRVFVGN